MDEADWLAARFEEQRPHLRAVAYRMLGSRSEADDAVQNSWLRLSRRPGRGREPAGWLTTVVGRECLKMMRARRSRREEPLADITAEPPAGRLRTSATPRPKPCWLTRSDWPCWCCLTPSPRPSAWPSSCTTSSPYSVQRDRRHPRTFPGRGPPARQPGPQAGPGRNAASERRSWPPAADRRRLPRRAPERRLRGARRRARPGRAAPGRQCRPARRDGRDAGSPRRWGATRSASRGAPS